MEGENALDRVGKRAGQVTVVKHRTMMRSVKSEKLIKTEFTSTGFTILCLT